MIEVFYKERACLVIHLAALKSFKLAQVIAQSSSTLKSMGKKLSQPAKHWSIYFVINDENEKKKPVIIEK